jgi:pimeloyl-ACP methyl ester carboxylesterase
MDQLDIPDTALVHRAVRTARVALDRATFDHSLRVYAEALRIARRLDVEPDVELLLVAALFHDLTRQDPPTGRAPQLRAADRARSFLIEHGLTEIDATTVWLAIARQDDLEAARERDLEPFLIATAIAADRSADPALGHHVPRARRARPSRSTEKESISMTATTPTVVLVHGAFADAASFAPVTHALLAQGYDVVAPPVLNRSLSGDAAYVRSGVTENVVGLVYVAGYALDEGESLGQLQGGFPDSDLAANLVYRPYPVEGADDGTDVSVDVAAFPAVFAAGLADDAARVLAVSQRPLSAVAFGEPASVAAWKTRPSWGIVASADHTINPEVERFGYGRAGARKVVEIDGPHLLMQTHPTEVAQVITDAISDLA